MYDGRSTTTMVVRYVIELITRKRRSLYGNKKAAIDSGVVRMCSGRNYNDLFNMWRSVLAK